MTIAIAILNWNGKALLKRYLPSVIRFSENAMVYVIDNGSSDGSLDLIREEFPMVSSIALAENFGFAGGYNEGLKSIKADIYCLLNNDVEVTENWLDPIMNAFQEQENTAIIQPKILNAVNRKAFDYAGAAGGFIDKYGYPYCRGRIFNHIENDSGQFNDSAEIFWASGACLFIRSHIYDMLGGFDARFFAHMEEIDLCWRAFNREFFSKYIGNSVVYHEGGATLDASSPNKTYLNFRNSLFMLLKNLPKGKVFSVIFSRLVLDGVAFFKFLLEADLAHAWAIPRAHFSFYRHMGKVRKMRVHNKTAADYYGIRSIVWKYFVYKKRTYRSL